MSQEYKVKLEVFEGPLDLLLYLIKKDEVDIYDISLERITGQYLEFMDAFKALDLEVAGEFVVMAANLIYLKSRALLGRAAAGQEAEEDPRWSWCGSCWSTRSSRTPRRSFRSARSSRAIFSPAYRRRPTPRPSARWAT
jgi:chromatin segregation and condensation protein Rec8/ScpA/Scc1 (kleisin family)